MKKRRLQSPPGTAPSDRLGVGGALLLVIVTMCLPSCDQSPSACATSAQCFAMESCQLGECVMAEQPSTQDMMMVIPDMAIPDMSTPDMAIQDLGKPDFAMPDLPDPVSCKDAATCQDGELCFEGRCVECLLDDDCLGKGLERCVEQVCEQDAPSPDITFEPESDLLAWRHVHSTPGVLDVTHIYATDPFSVRAPADSQVRGEGAIEVLEPRPAERCQWRIWGCAGEAAEVACVDAAQSGNFPSATGSGVTIQPIAQTYQEFVLSNAVWMSLPDVPWVLLIEQFDCGGLAGDQTRLRKDWVGPSSWRMRVTAPDGEVTSQAYELDFNP